METSTYRPSTGGATYFKRPKKKKSRGIKEFGKQQQLYARGQFEGVPRLSSKRGQKERKNRHAGMGGGGGGGNCAKLSFGSDST